MIDGEKEEKEWYSRSEEDVLTALDTSENGLSSSQVKERLSKYGENIIQQEKPPSAWKILLRQLRGFFNVVLYIAATIAFAVGKLPDGIFVCAILVLNTSLSFYQEYKAHRAMAALRGMLVEKSTVIRDSQPIEVEASQIVPGDILDLSEGEKIPADARLIEAHALRTDESMLTGESTPVSKGTKPVPPDTDLGDRVDMIYAGSYVVAGTGKAIAVATAMKTELGKIATALQETKSPPTPFEREVGALSQEITYTILGLVVIVGALLYFVHHVNIADVFIFSLSLGVGAIPESLPVVLSFSLAMGAQQMVHRKALSRRLAVVESLGSVDTIGSDKTGTLTKNEMTVQALYLPNNGIIALTGEGYDPKNGTIGVVPPEQKEHLEHLLTAAALCNDARKTNVDGQTKYLGDPTEIALLVAAEKAGLSLGEMADQTPRVDEIPFTSERKRMTTIHEADSKRIAFIKGAPETVLEMCKTVSIDGTSQPLTDEGRAAIQSALEKSQRDALRVLAVAERKLTKGASEEEAEKNLTFLGLVGMIDPPRPEAQAAIAEATGAGIRSVMITGDHALTAQAIAKRLGLGLNTVTGREVEAMSDADLLHRVPKIDIVARATPLVKQRVLKALQSTKHFTAMTGDGVNDAPALKQADVGIAMGLRGTDAAKEAAGLVLLDDNFATIVAAIEEGRRIFDNIRKFVNYLLTCNIGEVIAVFFGALTGLLPVTAIMVLWVNIITDVLPAIALGVDPANPGMMKRPARPHDEPILNKPLLWITVFIGIKKGIMIFGMFLVGYFLLSHHDLAYGQTMAFTAIILYSFVRIFVIRTFDTLKFWSNPWLVVSLGVAVILQLAIIYTPGVNGFFGLKPLGLMAWGTLLVMAISSGFLGVWISKWVEQWAGSVIDISGAKKLVHAFGHRTS
ncbi:MAG TPA: HAD family hydrolase [Candidatus Acetothermia bacterium]|nr:HAD family hydrolase [Candidatus Acetothermia bacterium]